MNKREKRKRKKRNNLNIYVYSFSAIMICIIISSAIYQTLFLPEKEKLPAEDYFEIRDAIPTDFAAGGTDEILFITQVRFNLTAVGGDAHSVLIFVSGMAAQEEWPYFSEMKQNETIDVTVPRTTSLAFPVRSIRTPEGKFPFKIRIDSTEAYGDIIILL